MVSSIPCFSKFRKNGMILLHLGFQGSYWISAFTAQRIRGGNKYSQSKQQNTFNS